jgi:hypothetical protein
VTQVVQSVVGHFIKWTIQARSCEKPSENGRDYYLGLEWKGPLGMCAEGVRRGSVAEGMSRAHAACQVVQYINQA